MTPIHHNSQLLSHSMTDKQNLSSKNSVIAWSILDKQQQPKKESKKNSFELQLQKFIKRELGLVKATL
jgi:hypothetical protein